MTNTTTKTKSEAQIAHEERNAKLHEEAIARRAGRIDAHNERNQKRHEEAVAKKADRKAAHEARNAKLHEEKLARKMAEVPAE